MKATDTQVIGKHNVKLTTTTVVTADGLRVTKTATMHHRGRTLLLQAVTIDGKTLYKRQQVFGESTRFHLADLFAWIRLGYHITPKRERLVVEKTEDCA